MRVKAYNLTPREIQDVLSLIEPDGLTRVGLLATWITRPAEQSHGQRTDRDRVKLCRDMGCRGDLLCPLAS